MAKFLDKYLTYIVAIAIVAVIISRRSSTVQVLQTMASAMSNILGSIVAPINNGGAAETTKPTAPTSPLPGAVTAPSGSSSSTNVPSSGAGSGGGAGGGY